MVKFSTRSLNGLGIVYIDNPTVSQLSDERLASVRAEYMAIAEGTDTSTMGGMCQSDAAMECIERIDMEIESRKATPRKQLTH